MWVTLLSLLVCVNVVQSHTLFQLSVIHVNDIHARFEETSKKSTRCITDCIGGISRLYTAVNKLIEEQPNAIFLNAGDTFQGTLWYNYYGWNVTQYFLNKFPTDAYTLGNHEFDDGIEGVVPFMKALNCPIIVANMDISEEPALQGLFNKSTILIRNNTKIGVIGVIAGNTDKISRSRNLKFTNEVTAVNSEAERLVQEENCTIIIVLSHCGIDIDKKIAEEANPHIGLIVGGHSHTFLYSGSTLPGPDKPKGPYPTVVTNKHGKKVLIVQAALNTKYLGNISVWYNEFGDIEKWEGNPIYLDHNIPQDLNINKEIEEWKISLDTYGNTIIGTSHVLLDRTNRRTGECNIGSFLTDAMVDYFVPKAENGTWTYASVALINSGAIRTSIEPGNITIYDLVASQPFENSIDCIELTGQNIKDLFEYSVTTSVYRQLYFHEFLQVSGVRVTFNIEKPVNERVVKLKLRCQDCMVPNYYDVNYTKTYRVVIPSFLVDGGDGYDIIKNHHKNRIIGDKDLDVFIKYIKKMSPITIGEDERILIDGTLSPFDEDHEFSNSEILQSNFFTFIIIWVLCFVNYK